MPIRTVRRRRGGSADGHVSSARSTRAPGGRRGARRRRTRRPRPRRPGSTRRSPTGPRWWSRRGSAGDVVAAVRFARERGTAGRRSGHRARRRGPSEGTVFVSTRRLQGVHVDPVARVARVEAGVRWRQVIDAAVPHGLAPLSGSSSGVGRRRLHPRRRDGPPGPAPRLRGRPRARDRAGHRRRARSARSPPRATRSCSGRCAAARAASGSSPPSSSTWFRCPAFFGGAMFFTGADIERVLRAFGAWAPTMPEEVTTSVALLRLPRSTSVPPPLRGVGQPGPALRLHRLARRGEALLAPMRRVAPGARLDRPDVVRRGRPHPHGPDRADAGRRPAGRCCTRLPDDLVDALLAVAGPGRRHSAGGGRATADGRRARPPGRRPERGRGARGRVRAGRCRTSPAAAGGRRAAA